MNLNSLAMTKREVIHWIIILVTVTSCVDKELRIVYRERQPIKSNLSRLDSLYSDSLMVFFEQGFDNTLINIEVNDTLKYEEIISTAQEIQLATVKNVGSINENQKFNISINNCKVIPIKIVPPFKYVAVSYLEDTVYIDYMIYYPMYE